MAGTLLAGENITADLAGVPNWTSMTLLNSWTNTGGANVTAKFRKWKLLNSVECIGCINAGTLTDATTIAALVDAPASQQFHPAVVEASTGAAQVKTPMFYVDTSANLKIQSIPSSTTTLTFHFWYSLDA